MLLYTQKQCDLIRKTAWLEAARFFGSERKLGLFLGVEQSTISKWIHDPKIPIPYDKALAVEEIIGHISIERLLPNHPINKYLDKRVCTNELMEVLIDKIVITDLPYLSFQQPDRNIIIDADGILISGLVELQAYKKAKKAKIKVVILEVKELLLGTNIIKSNQFIVTELVGIGLRLQQLLGNRQGQRNDLNLKALTGKINDNNLLQANNIGYAIIGRTDHKIASILGFSSKDSYIRAKKVYLNGSKELIQALIVKHVPIGRAAVIAKFPKNQQAKFIRSLTKKQLIY